MPRNSDTRAATVARSTYATRRLAQQPEALARAVAVVAIADPADFVAALATRRVRDLLDVSGPASPELRARVAEILAPVLASTPTRGVIAHRARGVGRVA